jgi:Arc/MetJ-type ribon-helix-helix transcriptional regulator
MTINLPIDLESSIQAAIQGGRFPSIDEAMTAAARLLLREFNEESSPLPVTSPGDSGLGSIGAMRDAADELDEAMEYAMKLRQQPWRVTSGE